MPAANTLSIFWFERTEVQVYCQVYCWCSACVLPPMNAVVALLTGQSAAEMS